MRRLSGFYLAVMQGVGAVRVSGQRGREHPILAAELWPRGHTMSGSQRGELRVRLCLDRWMVPVSVQFHRQRLLRGQRGRLHFGSWCAAHFDGFPTLALSGEAGSSTTKDSIFVSVGGTAHRAVGGNYFPDLSTGTNWQAVEFNVFGDGNASQAVFNAGSTIVVKNAVTSTTATTNAPTCEPRASQANRTASPLRRLRVLRHLPCAAPTEGRRRRLSLWRAITPRSGPRAVTRLPGVNRISPPSTGHTTISRAREST